MKQIKSVRRATYVIKVPIQFTFVADNDIDLDTLYRVANKELERRLENGYFDVLHEDIDVVSRRTHYSREELEAQRKSFSLFIGERV